MKKLRCTSCNGDLELDDNKEIATCKFCGTKYKMNEDMTIKIKLDDSTKEVLKGGLEATKKAGKFMIIPFIVFFIIFISIVVLGITAFVKTQSSFDKDQFNNQFLYKNGTQYKIFVDTLLNDVSTSNKTNKKHKVTVQYKDKSVVDGNEIINLKKSLNNYQYEVIYSYDDKGFITKITIEDIK